jgi:hypothetical protein
MLARVLVIPSVEGQWMAAHLQLPLPTTFPYMGM